MISGFKTAKAKEIERALDGVKDNLKDVRALPAILNERSVLAAARLVVAFASHLTVLKKAGRPVDQLASAFADALEAKGFTGEIADEINLPAGLGRDVYERIVQGVAQLKISHGIEDRVRFDLRNVSLETPHLHAS